MTKTRRIDRDEKKSSQSLLEASEILKSGGIVALPTDTLYGIACLVGSDSGIQRVYDIKKRQAYKPVAICVSSIADFHSVAEITVEDNVLKDLFPGPVTTIFKRKPSLNPSLNPKTELVGIRIPDYPPIVNLVELSGQPLALTSANISEGKSSLQPEDFRELWSDIDLILDGGVISPISGSEDRRGSTVIDLSTRGQFHIVREGVGCPQLKQMLTEKAKLSCV